MNEFSYSILVIDDEKDINDLFDPLKELLKEEDKINVEFTYQDNITNFNIDQPFDIVLFDSKFLNTKHDFGLNQEQNTIGFNLIKQFREKNKRTKIIFCSSHFDLSEPDQIPYGPKDFFKIINELNIFRMVNKNSAVEVYTSIKEAIENLDIIMITLEKMLNEYQGIDINYEVEGESIPVQRLLHDFKVGGEASEKFRKEVMDIVLSYMSKFNV
jgi:hypothetical protein